MAKQRICYLLLLLISFLFFLFFRGYLSHLLMVFLLILPVFSLIAALPGCFLLKVDLRFDTPSTPKQQETKLILRASNSSILPCAWIKAKMECNNSFDINTAKKRSLRTKKIRFSIGPRQTVTLNSTLVPEYCGQIHTQLGRVWTCDLLGLWCLPVRSKKGSVRTASLSVFPASFAVELSEGTASFPRPDGESYSKQKPGDDPSELFQLRDYREGDSLRSIHWKVSTRLERLIVKEFGLPQQPAVSLLLEIDPSAQIAEIDRLIEAFSSLSNRLLEEQLPHRVFWAEGPGDLRQNLITSEDGLAACLHELFLSTFSRDRVLPLFSERIPSSLDSRVFYFTTGNFFTDEERSSVKDIFSALFASDHPCQAAILVSSSLPPSFAKELQELGCEIENLALRAPETVGKEEAI